VTPYFDYGSMGKPYEGFLKANVGKKKEKEKKKVKISELEKHPFFRYIPKEILNFMTRMGGKKKAVADKELPATPPDEIAEDKVVYNVEELPIQLGDYVVCNDFEGLNKKQVEFLKEKPYYKVRSVCGSRGGWYQSGEPHIDLGYRIPFKMIRFTTVDRNIEGKYKVLFLQFDLPIDMHGEEDKHNFFKGQSKMSDLFEILFRERIPDAFVDFAQYDDIYRTGPDFYIENMKLKDYDFVFFGFMANFTTIVKMLISYLDKYSIPYLKYGTYKDFDNKAYEMHLLDSLGYPYIPSIMASRLTKRVIDAVKEFGFPVIVKDINLNRGEGVWKVDSMKELMKVFNYGNKLMIIQKFVPNDGDFRVISIKNKVELVIKKERIKGTKEFRANVARGGKAVKGTLPTEIIKMCEDISKHLVCDIVGFDIIQDMETKEYYVMETNSSPHFPTFSVISEIDIPGIITDYIIKQIKKKK
jgi:glutathione synthase/RimK-type ligase-like ATP-grasp enzyme